MSIPGNHNYSVAILGIGGIGGLLASLCWKNDFTTTCVVKPDSIEEFTKNGIHLKSNYFGDFVSWPRFVSSLDMKPDILFVTTKANDLAGAINSIPTRLVKDSAIVPFLNGIGHVELLLRHFGDNVIVGMIGKVEAKKTNHGVIEHNSSNAPEVELTCGKANRNMFKKTVGILRKIGMSTVVIENQKEVVWRKLARVNAIACLTALYNQPLGFIRDSLELRQQLEDCVKEGVLVAQAEGVRLDPQEIIKQINSLPWSITSSLQRDIANGYESELEAIPGAVLRCAKQHHISCPAINKIYRGLLLKVSQQKQ